ncbi:Acg family FMN-binding oxidoreductase [Ascidiimonas aurantiaca]|uniref:Acg family FMN-binding oxidoreductase n=1 Tax=Ascidiimonas aurantiaca TaxID=1685432 RepID=UPI0030EDAAA1
MEKEKSSRINELKHLIYFAVKAPSGHNTQPWKFKVTEEGIEIHPDLDRALPATDPLNRELYISLGCALENLVIAAHEFNYEVAYRIVQTYNNTFIIKVALTSSGSVSIHELFSSIELRQTNRSVYDKVHIAPENIKTLLSIRREGNTGIHAFRRSNEHFEMITDFLARANSIRMQDPEYKKELLDWMRFNPKDTSESKDGLSYKAMGTPPMPEFMGKSLAKGFINAHRQTVADMEKINSSSHIILFSTQEQNEKAWILLGVTLERFLLLSTKMGMAHAYINLPCEVDRLVEEMRDVLPIDKEYPNILLRIGYADRVSFSKRKDIEDVIF